MFSSHGRLAFRERLFASHRSAVGKKNTYLFTSRGLFFSCSLVSEERGRLYVQPQVQLTHSCWLMTCSDYWLWATPGILVLAQVRMYECVFIPSYNPVTHTHTGVPRSASERLSLFVDSQFHLQREEENIGLWIHNGWCVLLSAIKRKKSFKFHTCLRDLKLYIRDCSAFLACGNRCVWQTIYHSGPTWGPIFLFLQTSSKASIYPPLLREKKVLSSRCYFNYFVFLLDMNTIIEWLTLCRFKFW